MAEQTKPAHLEDPLQHLDEKTLRLVDLLARRDGLTRAQVIVTAVREYIAKNAVPDDAPTPPPKGG